MAFKSAVLLLIASLASEAVASCAHGTFLMPRAEEEGGAVKVGNFGYVGAKGPVNWVALDPAANALCATGKNQSPIDMTAGAFTMIPAAELSLKLPDMLDGTEFENLGTTVEVIAKGGTMDFAGKPFTLQQFHFHLPSEHLDNGTSNAMEMHMVFQSEDQKIAVVSVFIDVNDGAAAAVPAEPVASAPATSASAEPAASSAPAAAPAERAVLNSARSSSLKEKEARRAAAQEQSHSRRLVLPGLNLGGAFFHVNAPSTAAITPSSLLDTVLGSVDTIATPGTKTKTGPIAMSEILNVLQSGSFQTYEGSLTTPPCSEGVRWLVSNQKLSIKMSTFVKARDVIGFNSRFPQGTLGEDNVLAMAMAKAV